MLFDQLGNSHSPLGTVQNGGVDNAGMEKGDEAKK